VAGVRIVLVRPEHSANVGAVARAVANTGLAGLDLVAPGDWRTVDCWRTAWGAAGVLEQARVFRDLRDAVAQATYVVALSRRESDVLTLDVRAAAAEIAALPPDAQAALVFGPEASGLSLDELAQCGRVAFIPSHPAQPSLNLSHAVMIAAYEVFRSTVPAAPRPQLATHAEKERVLALLTRGLDAMHALWDAERGVYARLWRGLIHRMDLVPRETRLLAHMARKMARANWPSRAILSARDPSPGARRILPPQQPAGGDLSTPPPQGGAGARPGSAMPVPGQAQEDKERPHPFTDVAPTDVGFSIPVLKWRELLFVGALRREGDLVARDPLRPLPPFERPDLFPENARFEVVVRADRVDLIRR
jgi:TrmH family RNA methyltransferase